MVKRGVVPVVLAALGSLAYGQQQPTDWYPLTATSDPAAGEIGMADWLDKPAGRHGRILRQGDALLYDGKPIKLWGINLCFGHCLPSKEIADRRAAFYPKYGINSVRLHKFVESEYQSADSAADYNPQALDRMDYQIARFKEAGIYVDLSAHFGAVILGPADRKYVPYIDEFGSFEGKDGKKVHRLTAAHSSLFYSPELQDLHIQQIVNLLKHKNPHTGLTYAQDPAIAFLEIINEQSIFFYTSTGPLKQYPTIRRMTAERFSDWLKARYGSQEGLVKAWGQQAFDGFAGDGFPAVGENLDKRNILPIGNPWYWDPAQLNGSQAFRKQRLLDTLQFLYELQSGFYQRYLKAVREAGYEGEIVGSNWQAGRAFGHFANLHTDWQVGTIDRHNYFGGGSNPTRRAFGNGSMLEHAGSGILSTGMQQVADRPFMLSEWIHVFPSEWGAEGPTLIGAYGLGLQGWDVSYMFQNGDAGQFSESIGRDMWDAVAPQVLGLFPAVARQVLRGDVATADATAVRHVHMPSVFEGKLSFEDTVEQGYDAKQLDSSKVPAKALAVARSVVAFGDKYEETPAFDPQRYVQDGLLLSSTGQLRWKEGQNKLDGFFTIDTPGTKAVVGFAAGQTFQLGDVTIRPDSPFAAIYITAQDKAGSLAQSKRLLIIAMARARNTGMQFNTAGDRLVRKGKPPILLEPVKATIALSRPGTPRAIALDHDGRRTPTTLPVEKGAFTIDGARDKTPYYLIEYP